MNRFTFFKILLLIVAIIGLTFNVTLHAQHLFSISQNNLSKKNVTDLKAQITRSKISTLSVSQNRENKDIYSVPLTSAKNTNIIIMNEQTGSNVVINPVEGSLSEFQLSPFFIEELKQGVLGNANYYLLIETTSDFSVRNVAAVDVPNENLFIPQYFYGKKENVKEATPSNRQIINIFKQKPCLISAFPDDPEQQRYIEQLEEEMSYYVYMYKLPDGALRIYDEHFNSDNEKSLNRVGGNLAFDLSGSMTSTQRIATEYALALWSDQLMGTIPIDINVTFTSLQSGILGASYQMQNFFDDGTYTDYPDTWYPSSLWNQIVGYDATNLRDIRLEMNSNYNFYFGLDGNTSGVDYVTIVLHEVTHGLGFSSLCGSNGAYTYSNAAGSSVSTSYPGIYDRMLYEGLSGSCLTDLTQVNRSNLLKSNNLYAGRPNSHVLAANNGVRVKVFAPTTYMSGSSTSHWDNTVSFPTFMRYAYTSPLHAFNARKIGILMDMGWMPASPSPCPSVYNLAVNYTYDCKALLTWIPRPQATPATFNIYRDSTLIASNIATTSYIDTGFNSLGGHIWSVALICSNNEESNWVSVTKAEACIADMFCGGSGTENDPYQICNALQLYKLATYVNAGNGNYTAEKYYILTHDIDLSGYPNWERIGTWHLSYAFQGHFDGNGKVVQNLTINQPLESNVGLFGYILNASIKNLGVNCNVTGGSPVGGLAGYMRDSNISNCYVTGVINGDSYIGGLVGRPFSDQTMNNILYCYTNCDINGGDYIGGLVGGTYSFATISNCYTTGNVSGNNYVGGLIGSTSLSNINYIFNSYATGKVTGTDYIGGIAGRTSGGTILSNCVAANDTLIATIAATNINRIVGVFGVSNLITNNYAFNDMVVINNGQILNIVDDAKLNGWGRPIETLTSLSFYATAGNWFNQAGATPWSITGVNPVWSMCPLGGFPYLSWQQNVNCAIPPEITISDTTLNFGNVNTGATASLLLNIQGAHLTEDLTVSVNGNGFGCVTNSISKENVMAQGGYNITVTFSPLLTQSYSGTLTLNSSEISNITVNLTGAGVMNSMFCGGTGTENDPYQICNAQSLSNLATYINDGNGDATLGKYYIVTHDIDLSEYANWTPIGIFINGRDFSKTFQGNFNGDNHVITHLTINRGNESYIGLFGCIRTAFITNLGIEIDSIIGGSYVGGLTGYMENSNIDRCYTIGNVNAIKVNDNNYVGGLVAYAFVGNIISNCYTTGNINGGGSVGGLVGLMNIYYNDINTIFSCYATGNINGTAEVGGLVGYMSETTISNCYATGKVTGKNTPVGGLIGYFGGTARTISNCYATGKVTGKDYIGGLVGYIDNLNNYYYSIISNCVAANDTIIATSVNATHINRIAGTNNSGTDNNYALNNMAVIKNGQIFNIVDDNSLNGWGRPVDTLISLPFYATAENWYGTTPNWYGVTPWSITGVNPVWSMCPSGGLPYLSWQQNVDCLAKSMVFIIPDKDENSIDNTGAYELETAILIYPNPATNMVTVQITPPVESELPSSLLETRNVELYDVYGKLLRTVPIVSSTTSIDVSTLSSGIYFISLNTGDGRVVKKLIKN